jgi:hypothetical protein
MQFSPLSCYFHSLRPEHLLHCPALILVHTVPLHCYQSLYILPLTGHSEIRTSLNMHTMTWEVMSRQHRAESGIKVPESQRFPQFVFNFCGSNQSPMKLINNLLQFGVHFSVLPIFSEEESNLNMKHMPWFSITFTWMEDKVFLKQFYLLGYNAM